ncbi:MAG: DUF1223 domain-containing protein [Alphaproteobacteria bacterium]|jgi:hypothetical protein|nr:DUF1223 domain-containing protein [Alphaproteobacteria bacterium]
MRTPPTVLTTALALLLWAGLQATPGKAEPLKTVVELFTSQGCNSCPPADAYLGRLAKREDLIGLTFHVDYWDYLGWRDTFASPLYTERQRSYATAMQDRRVYTPQMVIGGAIHAVGSDEGEVTRAIDKVRRERRAGPDIEMMRDGKRVLVKLSAGAAEGDATIWLARYDNVREVAIRRGENGGRQLSYYNVVRQLTNVGLWRGEAMEIAFPLADLAEGGRDGCAIIVQLGGHGAIIGAAEMDLAESDS